MLAHADVIRANAAEAERLTSRPIENVEPGRDAGDKLLEKGPSLVVLEVPREGNVFVSHTGAEFLPHLDVEVVDPTGAGDSLIAALTASLNRGEPSGVAARRAVAAAASTAGRLGGRPNLTLDQ